MLDEMSNRADARLVGSDYQRLSATGAEVELGRTLRHLHNSYTNRARSGLRHDKKIIGKMPSANNSSRHGGMSRGGQGKIVSAMVLTRSQWQTM